MHRSTKEIDENINKNQKLNDRELLSICATLLFTWYYSNHAVTTAASRLSFLATGDFWSTVCPQGPLKQQEILSRLHLYGFSHEYTTSLAEDAAFYVFEISNRGCETNIRYDSR